MGITLYDIPSSGPRCAWSPNTWKVRYCLNYKDIPYKTEWVEYPDIETYSKKLGIPPTTEKKDGSPHYTVPFIHDSSTGIYMADSIPIAEYLEKQYPNTPSVFPHGTWGLQIQFRDVLSSTVLPISPFIVSAMCSRLNPTTHEFYRSTREKSWEKNFDDIRPKGEEAIEEWKKVEERWSKVAYWYSGTDGPFLMGDTVSWADFVVGGHMIWYRTALGEDSKEWKDIMSWDGGHWKKFCEAINKYETVV